MIQRIQWSKESNLIQSKNPTQFNNPIQSKYTIQESNDTRIQSNLIFKKTNPIQKILSNPIFKIQSESRSNIQRWLVGADIIGLDNGMAPIIPKLWNLMPWCRVIHF